MALVIPDEVFDFFASNPAAPALTVAHEVSNLASPIRVHLEAFLCAFDASDVAAAGSDPECQFIADRTVGPDRAARAWLAERTLTFEIPRRRLQVLRDDALAARPRPYGLPALEDLEIADDHLVSLLDFDFDGARLIRNGFAFLVLATTGSPNSTHWLLRAIYNQGLENRTRVRLDPFLYGPASAFPAMFYRMWMYGRPLDWPRVEALREPDHGRWLPGALSHRCEFTDYAWIPRAGEAHFVCEEVPTVEDVPVDGARYFHAIYAKQAKSIQHFDGAIRLYTMTEIEARHDVHARNAGKMGLREKVFLTDGPVSSDALSEIAQTFFVWNEDVQQYFGHTLVSGSAG